MRTSKHLLGFDLIHCPSKYVLDIIWFHHCATVMILRTTSCHGAERDIAKGEQLLHTYGDLSDAQLLQTYGFVQDFEPGYNNPHNFVSVPSQLVLQSCSEPGDEVLWSCARTCSDQWSQTLQGFAVQLWICTHVCNAFLKPVVKNLLCDDCFRTFNMIDHA